MVDSTLALALAAGLVTALRTVALAPGTGAITTPPSAAPPPGATAPIAASAGAAAQEAAATLAARMLEGLREATGAPGLSIAVGARGRLLWSATEGYADLENGAPATPATRFRCGSVSKVITAAALLRLAERREVELDAPIHTYLPDFPRQTNGPPVTLRLLAGHLAGVRHYEGRDWAAGDRHYDSLGAALELFAADPLVAAPGERYLYSTHGYTLAGAALEAATGKPSLTLLADEVWRPLGLLATAGDDSAALVPGRSALYTWGPGGTVRNARREDPSYKWPGGGLLSTAEDLVRFGMAHLEGDFLAPTSRQAAFTSQTTADGKPTGVGVGWRLGSDWRGRAVYHHAGAMTGARSVLVLYPESGIAVAVLSNLSYVPAEVELTAQLLAEAFLPPTGTGVGAAADGELPQGDFSFEGTVADQPASGLVRLRGDRGAITLPTPLAELYRRNDAPVADELAIVGVLEHEGKRQLVLATPFGLSPLAVEPAASGGWTAATTAGRQRWSFTARPLSPPLSHP